MKKILLLDLQNSKDRKEAVQRIETIQKQIQSGASFEYNGEKLTVKINDLVISYCFGLISEKQFYFTQETTKKGATI